MNPETWSIVGQLIAKLWPESEVTAQEYMGAVVTRLELIICGLIVNAALLIVLVFQSGAAKRRARGAVGRYEDR